MSITRTFIHLEEKILDSIKKENSFVSTILHPERDILITAQSLNIDKSWHAIHYLITQKQSSHSPLNLVISGEEIISDDLGYGPATSINSLKVRLISEVLSKITQKELKKKFNPQEMMEKRIYPEIWRDQEIAWEYIWEKFDLLKSYYFDAACENHALITYFE